MRQGADTLVGMGMVMIPKSAFDRGLGIKVNHVTGQNVIDHFGQLYKLIRARLSKSFVCRRDPCNLAGSVYPFSRSSFQGIPCLSLIY
jgi:hypothetical protein